MTWICALLQLLPVSLLPCTIKLPTRGVCTYGLHCPFSLCLGTLLQRLMFLVCSDAIIVSKISSLHQASFKDQSSLLLFITWHYQSLFFTCHSSVDSSHTCFVSSPTSWCPQTLVWLLSLPDPPLLLKWLAQSHDFKFQLYTNALIKCIPPVHMSSLNYTRTHTYTHSQDWRAEGELRTHLSKTKSTLFLLLNILELLLIPTTHCSPCAIGLSLLF